MIKVLHKKYGEGEVIKIHDSYIDVNFYNFGIKTMSYPDSIAKDLLISEDKEFTKTAKKEYKVKCELINKQNAVQEFNNTTGNYLRNAVIKCKRIDNLTTEDHFGYSVKSNDVNLLNTILSTERRYPKIDEFAVDKYFVGFSEIDRLKVILKNELLDDFDDEIETTELKNDNFEIRQLYRGLPVEKHLGILTTIHPKTQKYVVFGVYIVDDRNGDEKSKLYCSSNLKIELTPQESSKFEIDKYCNYNIKYATEYLSVLTSNSLAVKLLKDIIKVKDSKEDKDLARKILQKFCENIKVDYNYIGK